MKKNLKKWKAYRKAKREHRALMREQRREHERKMKEIRDALDEVTW